MTTVDLHPEHLLDRARHGELNDAERRQLQAHLQQCALCDFELQVGGDFDALDQVPCDEAAVDRVTAGALAALEQDAGAPPAPRRVPATRRWVAAAAAVAFVAVGGGMAAAWWVASRAAPEPEPASSSGRATAPAPADTGAETGPIDPVIIEVADASADEARGRRAGSSRGASPRRPSAAELLARATEARRSGRDARAAALYRHLQRLYPGSREQRVSRVAYGRLLLDRLDRPSAALAQFDRYLASAPQGVLSAEARVGRALALGRLGRRARERDAWRAVIAHHPSSGYVQRAERRLEQLDGSR